MERSGLNLSEYSGKSLVVKYFPHMVRRIFERIPPKTVELLKFDQNSHPSKFILQYIPIPSTVVRADVRYLAGGRTNSDTLTTFIFGLI